MGEIGRHVARFNCGLAIVEELVERRRRGSREERGRRRRSRSRRVIPRSWNAQALVEVSGSLLSVELYVACRGFVSHS